MQVRTKESVPNVRCHTMEVPEKLGKSPELPGVPEVCVTETRHCMGSGGILWWWWPSLA